MVQLHPFVFVIVASFAAAGASAVARKISRQRREIRTLREAADGIGKVVDATADRAVTDPAQAAKIAQAIRDGNEILAIKLYRRATGAGLREAKDYIENQMHG